MRRLKKEELISEMLVRIHLRGQGGRLGSEIVRLVAEMIYLADQPVPNCYEQQTDRWEVTQ